MSRSPFRWAERSQHRASERTGVSMASKKLLIGMQPSPSPSEAEVQDAEVTKPKKKKKKDQDEGSDEPINVDASY